MNNLRVAMYCHADSLLSSEVAEQKMRRQQELLERFAVTHNMELIACYLHIGSEHLDLSEPVFLHMLQDAKRKDFDVILLEHFELFPKCAPEDIPPICLFSIVENRQIEIGESDAVLFDESPKLPSGATVYMRDETGENYWNLQL